MTTLEIKDLHAAVIADDGTEIPILKGVDLIQFDAQGLIVDFEVMVRPMSGLQALGEEMGKRLAPYLAAYKAAKPQ